MLNTLAIYQDLSSCMDDKAAKKLAEILGRVYEEVAQAVTKKEFNELKEIVRDLAHAQERTESRIEELAHAQERTESRIEELAHAQE
nr:hypothetical protein [Desulfobacterales bacterium]